MLHDDFAVFINFTMFCHPFCLEETSKKPKKLFEKAGNLIKYVGDYRARITINVVTFVITLDNSCLGSCTARVQGFFASVAFDGKLCFEAVLTNSLI